MLRPEKDIIYKLLSQLHIHHMHDNHMRSIFVVWLGSRVVSVLDSRSTAWVQIAVATLSGNSLRQTVRTHRAAVHQAAKLVTAFLRVARVSASLAESNGSLPSGL